MTGETGARDPLSLTRSLSREWERGQSAAWPIDPAFSGNLKTPASAGGVSIKAPALARTRAGKAPQSPETAFWISGTSGSGNRIAPESANACALADIFFQVLRMISSHFASSYSGCLAAKASM